MTQKKSLGLEASHTFRVREAARVRPRRVSVPPVPMELVVHDDGSAVVMYESEERLMRYESLGECLIAHELVAADLEPVD